MGTEREFILLTVIAEGSKELTIPEVRAFNWRDIKNIRRRPSIGTGFTIEGLSYIVAEDAVKIDLLRDLANTSEELAGITQLSIDALGSLQGAGVAVLAATYYAEVDTATDTTAEAVDINAAAVPGALVVIMNSTVIDLEVFPASGESINGAAVDAQYDHLASSRVTYYCKVAGAWLICPNQY